MDELSINETLKKTMHIQENKCIRCEDDFVSSSNPVLFKNIKNSDDDEDFLIAVCYSCVNGVHKVDPDSKIITNLKKELESQIQLYKEKQNDVDQNKNELLGMFSHEFKTPLVPIVGFSKILSNTDRLGPLSGKQLSAVKTIFMNAKTLSKRIEDMLDVRKIEQNDMIFHHTEFDVKFIVSSTLKNFSRDWFCEKVEIINSVPEKIALKSDEDRIRQILENLLLNAVDFVPNENGKIEIGAQDKGDSVYFYVKDNGTGIPKDKQELIFGKFYQDDISHKRKRSGLGLGLTLCKKLSESLGGKIWVESNVDKGSIFHFTILKQR
jgi:signal transduction histidine kinase